MPYNTRRKSLSLPSLGIQLPLGSRAHRSNSKTTPPTSEAPQPPPTKRVKRSHDDEPPSPISSTPSKVGSPAAEEITKSTPARRVVTAHTPPPSPGDVDQIRKVDTDGINDDIVIAVIHQLEKTGNRPHLIRDMAAILATTNDNLAHSANPAALLSSRLSMYLKRPWTALSPCPLAKELIPVHPRKVFFFLTTRPRGPLLESPEEVMGPPLNTFKRMTPTLSDPSVAEDDLELDVRERSRMSPSPEVELFSPELDNNTLQSPPTPGEAFSGRSSVNPEEMNRIRYRPIRAPSPRLEADERGFTETATAVRARGMSLLNSPMTSTSLEEPPRILETADDTPEQQQRRDQELGFALFGNATDQLNIPESKPFSSSPMIVANPEQHHVVGMSKLSLGVSAPDVEMYDMFLDLQSPETIGLDELDDMFADY